MPCIVQCNPVHRLVIAALSRFATQPILLVHGLGWSGLCGHTTAPTWLGLVWCTGLHGLVLATLDMQMHYQSWIPPTESDCLTSGSSTALSSRSIRAVPWHPSVQLVLLLFFEQIQLVLLAPGDTNTSPVAHLSPRDQNTAQEHAALG